MPLLWLSCRTAPTKGQTLRSLQQKSAALGHEALQLAARINPKNAVVAVGVAGGGIEAKDFGAGFKVPSFTIERQNSSFVQILRCREVMQDTLKNSIDAAKDRVDESEWTWRDAFGNNTMCQVASLRFMDHVFQDIAAPDGNYVYLLNPCVSQDVSETGKEACSFRLVVTPAIRFTGSPSSTFRLKAKALQETEDTYNFFIEKLRLSVQQLAQLKDQCAMNFATAQEDAQWGKAMGDLATLAGSLALGVTTYFGARALRSSSSSVGKTIAAHPGSFAMAAATGAGTISMIIRRALESNVQPGPKCYEADAAAKQIQALQEDSSFIAARDNLARLSSELAALDKTFQGYDASMFSAPIVAPAQP
jgi:hypothetical protein